MSRTVYLDARRLKERREAHTYLSKMLSLPSYYGNNLDALYDCITEMSGCSIKILHIEEAGLSGTYGDRILKVLEEGAEQNSGVEVKKVFRESLS